MKDKFLYDIIVAYKNAVTAEVSYGKRDFWTDLQYHWYDSDDIVLSDANKKADIDDADHRFILFSCKLFLNRELDRGISERRISYQEHGILL